jgi:hypothetical protein
MATLLSRLTCPRSMCQPLSEFFTGCPRAGDVDTEWDVACGLDPARGAAGSAGAAADEDGPGGDKDEAKESDSGDLGEICDHD